MAIEDYYDFTPAWWVNICFNCKNACGGCSWTAVDPVTERVRFEPVPGWAAEEVPWRRTAGKGRWKTGTTYHITACPQFVEG